jgi:hypothetical protein
MRMNSIPGWNGGEIGFIFGVRLNFYTFAAAGYRQDP